MARKFFFVCAGVLCLVIAYQLGASRAGASFVESNPLGIAAISGPSDPWHGLVLLDSGAIVEIQEGAFVVLSSTLPVPVQDVLAFEGLKAGTTSDPFRGFIITREGVVWTHGNVPGWNNLGPIPGIGQVPVEGQSFGKTKSKYR